MRRNSIFVALVAAGAMVSMFAFAPDALAQYDVVVVNSTADPGDGVCDAMECTLREALSRNSVYIKFDIPGPGPHTIRPASPLPLAQYVTIDGYSQPGARRNTNPDAAGMNSVLMIEIDGSLAGPNTMGFDLLPGYVTGLVINRFSSHGIRAGSETSGVYGNYIGTDVSGTVDLGNGGHGVYDWGDASITGNLIAGNSLDGVAGAWMMDVRGNLIGTDITGKKPLGNVGAGVHYLAGRGAEIDNNLIAANGSGILAEDDAYIDNNMIGAAGGDGALANHGDGIRVTCMPPGCGVRIANNHISGNAGEGVSMDCTDTGCGFWLTENFIANNGANGVHLLSAWSQIERNTIQGNAKAGFAIEGIGGFKFSVLKNNLVYDNGSLGIDLGVDGPTPNDPGDVDDGPNDLQNYPRLDPIERSTAMVASGELDSTPDSTYLIELFTSPSCDPSGFGEGRTPAGTAVVATDVTGKAHFAVPVRAAFAPTFFTATATRSEGGTSEFSSCAPVVVKANRFALPIGQKATYDRADPRAPKGVAVIEVTYRNPYAVAISDVYFRVVRLEYKNANLPGAGLVVLNASGGPAHKDARVVVPGGIPASGTVTVRYEIGLPIKAPFRLAADAYGRIGAAPVGSREMELVEDERVGWEFETDEGLVPEEAVNEIYMPVVGR